MDAGLIVARFVHFVATFGLFGGYLFAAAFAPPALRPDLAPLLRRLGPPLAALALLSAVAWLVLLAREMAEGALDFGVLADVATGTEFGRVWLARLILLALLLACVARRPDPSGPALLAGLALASLGLVGHAAMQTGALGAAHRANHALHLLAGGYWLGGLPMFLVALARWRAAPDRRDARAALWRFSRFGHLAVAVLFATGALDVALTTKAVPWPPATFYRAGLAAKIAVAALMTALALANRYFLAPRRAMRALAAGAVAEIALALIAVALVSGFATADPA